MKVVSNAGPLIALGQLGQLGLLLKLYDEVLIPQELLSLQEFELLINEVKARPELWISERLCDQALRQAHEENVGSEKKGNHQAG